MITTLACTTTANLCCQSARMRRCHLSCCLCNSESRFTSHTCKRCSWCVLPQAHASYESNLSNQYAVSVLYDSKMYFWGITVLVLSLCLFSPYVRFHLCCVYILFYCAVFYDCKWINKAPLYCLSSRSCNWIQMWLWIQTEDLDIIW